MQDVSSDFIFFLQSHADQFKHHGVPQNLYTLIYHKLVNKIDDAGDYFQFCEMPEGIVPENGRLPPYGILCKKEDGIKANSTAFIIQHHFMAEREDAMMEAAKNPQVLLEYEQLFGIDATDMKPADRLQKFYDLMWEYNAALRLRDKDSDTDICVWYLLDSVGLSLTYDQHPNCKLIPFFFMPEEKFYTLLIPIEDISYAELLTSDYLTSLQLLPDEFSAIPLRNRFTAAREATQRLVDSYTPRKLGKVLSPASSFAVSQQPYTGAPHHIYSQIELIPKYLTIEPFVITDNIEEADGMFILDPLSDEKFGVLKGTRAYVDQVQGQKAFTLKNRLIDTMKEAYGDEYTKVLPQSFDMSNIDDAKEFVATYFEREKKGLDNYWIVKPNNYTHGKGISIFNDISAITKTANSIPCICSKYIINPLLFDGKKFDLRFIILFKYDVMWNTHKPDIYLYDTFWTRFANNAFDLDDLTNYETHFTVMNYGHKLTKLLDTDFITQFDDKFGKTCTWSSMKEKIEVLISRAFDAAIKTGKCTFETNSCAIFGADVMIDADFTPYLLEMNFQPDCTRACEYDKDFYNKVFTTLFKETKWAKQIY